MADIATLGIRIDKSGATRDAEAFGATLDSLAARGESAVSRLKASFLGLSAATGLSLLGAKFLHETIESQNRMAQLTAAVKSTGGAAGLTVRQLDEMSKAMQQVTTYSDEAVKSAQAILLTFQQVKGDTFEQATIAAGDLATRMGGDLAGAALMVGKALQDPEHGLLALRRAGVSFSESQMETIKTLYATGQAARAQAMILKELEVEFGGSAKAARDTLGGALKGLSNDFGDLFELSTGQTGGMVDAINALGGAVRTVGEHMTEAAHAATMLGAVVVGRWLSTAISSTTSYVSALLAQRAATIATAESVVTANQRELFATETYLAASQAKLRANVALGASAETLAAIENQVANAQVRVAMTADAAAASQVALTRATSATSTAMAAGTGIAGKAVGALGGWVGLAIIANQIIGYAIDKYGEKLEKAAGQTDAQNAATERALATAHARAAAEKKSADAATDAQRSFAALQEQRTDELGKLKAVNAAHDQGAHAIALLTLRYDAMIQKAKDAKEHKGAELATLNKLTDAILAQQEAAENLAHANELAQMRDAGTDAMDAATAAHAKSLQEMHDEEAQLERLAYARQGGVLAIRAVADAEEVRQMVQRQGLAQGDEMYDEAVRTARAIVDQRHATEDLTESEAALSAARQQIVAREAQAASDRVKQMLDGMQTAMASFFLTIFQKGITSFRDLFSRVRDLFLELIAEMLAKAALVRIVGAVGGLFGFAQVAAAQGGAGTSSNVSPVGNVNFGHEMAAGVAGLGAGYLVGRGTSSGVAGAFGGAMGGAMTGYMIAGPAGAAVGALAGLAGGILGAADAARDARRQMDALKKSMEHFVASEHALLAGDSTGAAIESLKAQYDQARQALEDLYGPTEGMRYLLGTTDLYQKALDDLNATEAARIEQLRKEGDAAGAATRAGLNLVQGYKLQAAVFQAMTPRGGIGGAGATDGGGFIPTDRSASASRTSTSGSATVSDATPIVFQLDGRVLFRTTVAEAKAQAAALGFSSNEAYKAIR